MQKRAQAFLLLILFFLINYNSTAQSGANLTGKIIDGKTGVSLPGATVRVEETALGTYANKKGDFIIKHLRPGKYNLLVSMMGYETKKVAIEIVGREVNVEIRLSEQSLLTNEVVVSANKRVQAVQEVPISMSVINEESINLRNIQSLDNALEYLPGVEVTKDNVSIRGSSGFSFGLGSRVSLLLDGFPLLSGDNGDMKFDALPMFNVERIEVVKGAGSALYGTSAIGGVVNVITKKPTGGAPEFKFRSYTGIYTEPRYTKWQFSEKPQTKSGINAGYSMKYDEFAIVASGGYVRDESYQAYDDAVKLNAFAKFYYDFTELTSITLTGNFASDDRTDRVYWNSLDSATYPPDNTDRNIRLISNKLSVSSQFQHIFDTDNFFIIRAGIYATNFNNSLSPSNTEYRQSDANSINTEIQFSSRLFDETLLTYGGNFTDNSVKSATYGNEIQQIFSAYLQAENSSVNNLTATLGARIDQEETSGMKSGLEFSPKLGLSFLSPWDINFRASAGRGFRSPAIAERFSSLSYSGFVVIQNPHLLAEKSWSYEFGFNYDFELIGSPWYIDIAIFQNDMRDLIEPTLLTNGEIRFDNITLARIRGVEANLKTLFFGILGFETSLTYMDPRDITLGEPLKYRSEYLWYNRFYITVGDFEFQADYRYKSEFQRIDQLMSFIADADARVPFHIVDARIKYNYSGIDKFPMSFTLNAYNLLDYYYVEMVGNLGPTRYISLQVDTKF